MQFMKEFFMFGLLCLINPISGQEECLYIKENPTIYYEEKICKVEAVKKVNEMGSNLTSQGFQISIFFINCLVDKNKQNT